MPVILRESIANAFRLPRNDDILIGRAELLGERDRLLIEAVLLKGQSAASVAKLMGVSDRMIRDRVHLLSRRLCSRKFLDAARALAYLSPSDASLARLHFCEGLSRRELCRRLGLSSFQLRRRLDQISGQIVVMSRTRRGHSCPIPATPAS
jgi:DNA-directed RNA polymerase specialized sigma24 family protein